MVSLIFSVADFDLLRLLRWCRCISPGSLTRMFGESTVSNLFYMKLIKYHERSGTLLLTGRGHTLLSTQFDDITIHIQPSYRETDIRRRLRMAELVLTSYRAGLSVFTHCVEELADRPSIFLPSITRGRGTNPWGNTRVSGVIRLGDAVCSAHFVCPGIGKLILADELNTFSNNTATAALKEMRSAFLFAGESYSDVLKELESTDQTGTGRLISYGEAYHRSPFPVHLLSCDDIGAMQLRIMSLPGYKTGLARAALRTKYHPPSESFPDCDAIYDGLPFVVAVDMDLRRVDDLCAAAEEKGLPCIALAAMEAQAEAVLYARYRDTGKARVFTLTEAALEEFMGKHMTLYTPVHMQFLDKEGDVVDAPAIQTHRKTVSYYRER